MVSLEIYTFRGGLDRYSGGSRSGAGGHAPSQTLDNFHYIKIIVTVCFNALHAAINCLAKVGKWLGLPHPLPQSITLNRPCLIRNIHNYRGYLCLLQ